MPSGLLTRTLKRKLRRVQRRGVPAVPIRGLPLSAWPWEAAGGRAAGAAVRNRASRKSTPVPLCGAPPAAITLPSGWIADAKAKSAPVRWAAARPSPENDRSRLPSGL